MDDTILRQTMVVILMSPHCFYGGLNRRVFACCTFFAPCRKVCACAGFKQARAPALRVQRGFAVNILGDVNAVVKRQILLSSLGTPMVSSHVYLDNAWGSSRASRKKKPKPLPLAQKRKTQTLPCVWQAPAHDQGAV